MKLPALYVKIFLFIQKNLQLEETEYYILIFIQNEFWNTSTML
jgi:hypothetical protein